MVPVGRQGGPVEEGVDGVVFEGLGKWLRHRMECIAIYIESRKDEMYRGDGARVYRSCSERTNIYRDIVHIYICVLRGTKIYLAQYIAIYI